MANSEESKFLILKINGKLRPLDRGELYEDPIHDELENLKIGSVEGGGTLQSKTGEIEYCDVEIMLAEINEENIQQVKLIAENIGLPKGSSLTVESTGQRFELGNKEGLALYLNGTDLPTETYQTTDVNYVVEQIEKLIDGIGKMESYWEGNLETALYTE